jgi:hypothetical protein
MNESGLEVETLAAERVGRSHYIPNRGGCPLVLQIRLPAPEPRR